MFLPLAGESRITNKGTLVDGLPQTSKPKKTLLYIFEDLAQLKKCAIEVGEIEVYSKTIPTDALLQHRATNEPSE